MGKIEEISKKVTDAYRVCYFSGPWMTEDEAWQKAKEMEKEIRKEGIPLEYGVSVVEYDRPLIGSVGQANDFLQKYWSKSIKK